MGTHMGITRCRWYYADSDAHCYAYGNSHCNPYSNTASSDRAAARGDRGSTTHHDSYSHAYPDAA